MHGIFADITNGADFFYSMYVLKRTSLSVKPFEPKSIRINSHARAATKLQLRGPTLAKLQKTKAEDLLVWSCLLFALVCT